MYSMIGFVWKPQVRRGDQRQDPATRVVAGPRRQGVYITAGVAIAVVLVLVAPVARLVTPGVVVVPGSAAPAAGTPDPPPDVPSEYPPLPADSRYPDRVLPQVHTTATGERAFNSSRPDGSPILFDPCRPIHWVLNPDGMPAGGEPLLREAVAEISAATGLAFVDDGLTEERVSDDRESVQPNRYGERWAPVLVDWVDNAEVAYPDEEVAGVASRTVVTPSGEPSSARYVTGWVGLNRAWFTDALADPGRAPVARGLMLHELAHLVGLDHVKDPTQVMHATSDTTGLGDGDREGLAIAGAGECYADT
jgi:hypothetical protein